MVKGFGLFVAVALLACVAAAQTQAPGVLLSAGPNPPSAGPVSPSSTNNPGVQFSLTVSSTQTFTALYVKNAGSANGNDFSQLTLYRDNNSDGAVDNGDTLITTFASGTFPVYKDFSSTPVVLGAGAAGTNTTTFLVAIDVSAGATTGATFELTISPASVICSASVSGQDAMGATKTVSGGSTPGTLTITTTSLNNGAETVAYNEAISATGGQGPYTWSGTTIPGFLTLDTTQTGLNTTLSGTPAVGDAGQYTFTVQIDDSFGRTDNQQYTVTIVAVGGGVTIITTSLPGGTTGLGYNQGINSAGGSGAHTWSLSGGALPPGLALDTTATGASTTLSGTPSAAGTFNFTVMVADGAGSDTQGYTLTISQPGGGGLGGLGGGGGGGGGGCVAGTPAAGLAALPMLALMALRRRRK